MMSEHKSVTAVSRLDSIITKSMEYIVVSAQPEFLSSPLPSLPP